MRRKIFESYFYRIFLSIFGVCLVFALILGGIISGAFYSFYSANLEKQCAATAAQVLTAMENAASSYEKVLADLAEDEEIRLFFSGGEGQDSSEIMRELYILKNSFAQKAAVSVVRMEDRQWISTTNQVLAKSHAEFENWGVFRKAKEENPGTTFYAMARDALLSAEDRFCMAKACLDGEGKVGGYLLVEMPRSTIDAIVKEYSDQYNTSTLIINKTGAVIYHSEGISQEGLDKGGLYGISGAPENKTGVAGQKYAYCRSDALGLTFLQEMPSGIMQMIMRTIVKAMIPGIAVIVILALIFSRILAGSVSGPIKVMIESMSKIKQGDLSVRLGFRREDEIGKLGQAFDSMTEQMGELIEKVDEEKHSLWIAETRSLSLQMNPHFLYNTLDMIKWNAKLGRDREIVDITVMLGRVLRRIMNTKTDLVEVAYELEIVEAFVEIQKKRFGDRLKLVLELNDGIERCSIPKLVIQPIVENAIVHGFSGKTGPCEICIRGLRDREYLWFEVKDNGWGMTRKELEHILEFKQEGTHHIGLNNVQRRARLFGDDRCGIRVESAPGEGTAVTLVLKYKKEVKEVREDDEGSVG